MAQDPKEGHHIAQDPKEALVKRAELQKRLREAEVEVAKLRLDLADVDEKLAATGSRTDRVACW
jgi:hypothetical protein